MNNLKEKELVEIQSDCLCILLEASKILRKLDIEVGIVTYSYYPELINTSIDNLKRVSDLFRKALRLAEKISCY